MEEHGESLAELDELWLCFAEDARDALDLVEGVLLALEGECNPADEINRLYRAVHTFKGNSRVLGLPELERVTHLAEDLAGLVRDGGVPLDSSIIDCLFALLDQLREWLPQIVDARGDITRKAGEPLFNRLQTLIESYSDVVVEQIPQLSQPEEAEESEIVADEGGDPELEAIFLEMVQGEKEELLSSVEGLVGDPTSHSEKAAQILDDWQFAASRVGLKAISNTAGEALAALNQKDYESVGAAALELLSAIEALGSGAVATEELVADEQPFSPSDDAGYVKIFLDMAHEELLNFSKWIGAPDSEQKTTMLVEIIERLAYAAGRMEYVYLASRMAEALEELQASPFPKKSRLEQLERQLFGQLVAIQVHVEEKASLEPATLSELSNQYRLWYLSRLSQYGTALGYALIDVIKDDSEPTPAVIDTVVELCICLRDGILQSHAAELAIEVGAWEDILLRVSQKEIAWNPAFGILLADLAEKITETNFDGEEPDFSGFGSWLKASRELVSSISATEVGDRAIGLADLPLGEEFKKHATPEILADIANANERGESFYVLRADLENDEGVAAKFVQLVQSGSMSSIANVTVFHDDKTFFDFLVSSLKDKEWVVAQLQSMDPSLSHLSLQQGPFRPGDKRVVEPVDPKKSPQKGPAAEGSPALEVAPISSPARKEESTLKVESSKVEYLMNLAGEIGLSIGQLVRQPEIEGSESDNLSNSVHQLEMLVRELQDSTATLRLIPVEGTFNRMRRVVRDLTKETGKEIRLVLEGTHTEIDKVVVERIYEPLVHMLRNAADHGLESTVGRIEAGKLPYGTITLGASQFGTEVQISIRDDGKGLDRDKILERARERGLVESSEVPDDVTLFNFIFHPGFSTASTVSHLSGRGVGMDVVRDTIQALRGHINVESKRGQGTTVTLRLPLTLAFLEAMVARVGNRLFVLAMEEILEIFKMNLDDVETISATGESIFHHRGELISFCSLVDFYGLEGTQRATGETVVIVMETTFGKIAISVDELLGYQQVTLKPLEGQMAGIRAGVGCALLRSGKVAIALDAERLHLRYN